MSQNFEFHAYLAGPDVFFPGAVDIGKAKKEALAQVGITGYYPFDNEVSKDGTHSAHEIAARIAGANERMMADCCKDGRIGIILANMTPFHGPSLDGGTSFEIGFMSALAYTKPNVIIIGYTDDMRTFEERVVEKVYGGKDTVREEGGWLYGSDGRVIEAFGCIENLMITGAIEKTGGKIVGSFDEAAKLALQLAVIRAAELAV